MKNYDEVTNSLLERRDRYITEQNRKRKRIMGVATSLSCVCLVALLGFGMWQGGRTLPEQELNDAIYPGIKDHFDERNGESADNPDANTKIVVHSIKDISPGNMNIGLLIVDFVEMTCDEMKEYYGVDYVPDIPGDIKPQEGERSGIYKRDGGTGEVYCDSNILDYANEDFTRTVHLTVSKGNLPWVFGLYFNSNEEKSVINNIEVMIGRTESGYYAEFMYKNVGFILNASGVTQDEFVAIIKSILK